MKKVVTRVSKVFLVMAVAFSAFFTSGVANVFAASSTKKMAHLVSGANDANGHFGSVKPEAFVLSDKKDITNENFSFQLKLESEKADTRLRFVTKYVDDTHWGYVAYDGATGWFYEFKNGNKSGYPGLDLPAVNKNDIINVKGVYTDQSLTVSVENTTTKETKEVLVSNTDFLDLAKQAGQIGFGAGTYGTSYTDIDFCDVTIGDKTYQDGDYDTWKLYKTTEGQKWETSIDVLINDGKPEPEPSQQGRTWYSITGGANNGGGHAYGNSSAKAPILLLDNDKHFTDGSVLSLTLKPSDNWGVFPIYLDDSNWLYVGYDPTSKWYYQYSVNGKGNYPNISGLPELIPGEELNLSISLDREALTVIVNGTKVTKNDQNLMKLAQLVQDKSRFGVKTNGYSTISFADMTLNGKDCMEDNWVFCAERDGQKVEKKHTELFPVNGTVVDKNTKKPISGAVVRLNLNQTKTDDQGNYSFEAIEPGAYNMAVTKPGYQAYSQSVTVKEEATVLNVDLSLKEEINLDDYDQLKTSDMTAYIGKQFPYVARYIMNDGSIFRGNETALNSIMINGKKLTPTVTVKETTDTSRTYSLDVNQDGVNLTMDVKISLDKNTLTWQILNVNKRDTELRIETIDIPDLNLLSVDAVDKSANFAGAKASNLTTDTGDRFISFDEGFIPSQSDGYLYGILTNDKLSAALFSNSEIEGDKRIILNNGADTMSLTSAPYYYEAGDKGGAKRKNLPAYPTSELPVMKVAIAGDINGDNDVDWNDGAIAFRDIMNVPYGSEDIKNLVNYRIVMNFASMAPNPFLKTADNIKKVSLATDGLPQALLLKGYGNEGHDSANSEYADIAEREGGVEDFQKLIKIAHENDAEIGIHVNAQEAYPEAKSFNENMLQKPFAGGWGWLDQSQVIDKQWDLATQARWKRFVQLYDRINNTHHYDRIWPNAVGNSQGSVDADKETIQKEAESLKDNMDFIYLDVWYQDAWETRQIAKEINSLGWRFSTEFSYEGEYDSTWQHWSTDATYGGASAKGYNSDIIRFIRNDQRDSQVLNYPKFGGTADNPLLGGYRLYGFEGWSGNNDFNNYIKQTFNENLPTKFLQHYQVTDWENYAPGESPVGNHEKQITLKNKAGDTVIVKRNEKQRKDSNIERNITLNGKTVLNDVTYLLPWTDEDGSVKLYHWNLDGGTTTWDLPNGWQGLDNVVMYPLSDQGRGEAINVPVVNNKVTLNAKAATAYVMTKGASTKTVKAFGEGDYVKDPGFNAYANTSKLSPEVWSGSIDQKGVQVEIANTGDQRLAFNSVDTNSEVTTTISGLTPGSDYVAEVYVDNESDAKAAITVNTGKDAVTNYTLRSIAKNYVQCDNKHGTNMQRMQVAFKAESDTAKLTLSRDAGEGSTYMDDIRIVKQKLDNFQKDGSFTQDFESVVQGLYPFVLGPAQGITDPVTHLSQLHDPYTQAGWNGKLTSDVLGGDWSLKHHGVNTGIIYQTLPQNYRFEPGKMYTVEFDYQAGADKAFAMVVGDDKEYKVPTSTQYLAQARGTTQHVTMDLMASDSGQTWIGLYENGNKVTKGSNGEMDFILDNLKIYENQNVEFAEIANTDLYKGETSAITGNHLDKITWSSDHPEIAKVDTNTMQVIALSEGTAIITATLSDGSKTNFNITVTDKVIEHLDKDTYGSLSVSANTEELTGEGKGSGIKEAVVDGDLNTYWHSNWSGEGFEVSVDHPAIISVTMENPSTINAFEFVQRAANENGLVHQYSYRILGEDGSVLASGEHIQVPKDLQGNKSVITVTLDKNVKAKTIELTIEEGHNKFASLAEIRPVRIVSVAETATLKDTTVMVNETKKMDVEIPDNTVLKGIVWSSSDENVAIVSQDGIITGVHEGVATITMRNAVGLHSEAVVTVVADTS